VLPQAELERYCELIAALKLRTTNKQGPHLSTRRAIELLEDYGVEPVQGLAKSPRGVLHVPTINHYLSLLTDIFSLDGITGSQREYLYWLQERAGTLRDRLLAAELPTEFRQLQLM
jgi:hypothetical protein